MIFVDTNVLVAAASRRDNNHDVALELLETIPDDLLVPPTVIAEACYLLQETSGVEGEVRFLKSFELGELQLADLTTADVARMAELTQDYGDLRLGGTDASLIAIAERLGISEVATFDRRHLGSCGPFTFLPSRCQLETEFTVGELPTTVAVGEGQLATFLATNSYR